MSADQGLGMRRIERFLRRAAAGEDMVVGFLGGSITQGSLASSEENNYASLVTEGLRERYRAGTFACVNAGVGGTGSHYGAIRMGSDLMAYRPDIVILDFSVNDMAAVLPLYEGGAVGTGGEVRVKDEAVKSGVKLYPETWEGVIRRILSADNAPAVLVLNNVFYDTGKSVEDEHNAIADRYGVPHVSVRETILKRLRAGEFKREDISPDGLHPNDRGHRLIADEILKFLDSVDVGKAADGEDAGLLPEPVISDAFEAMKRLDIFNCAPRLYGFRPDPVMRNGYRDFFRSGWEAWRVGDRLCLDVECKELAVVYRKTIDRPAPVARLVLDGNERGAIELDSNFDEDWGDCLYLQPLLYHVKRRTHRVEIEITKAGRTGGAPFYLLCFGVG